MLKIYKASAGSGKTYTLAYEYIRDLLGVKDIVSGKYLLCTPRYLSTPGIEPTTTTGIVERENRHRHILAITFTNKATEEMKRRIINELDALSLVGELDHPKANYKDDLCREFGCQPDELAKAASKALKQLLEDYSNFNVTTIDSFFQRVLRTFAHELDRQGDFNVEISDITAVQSAVGTMIDDFNAQPAQYPLLEKWIYDFMYSRLDEGARTNFFNRSSQLHTQLVTLVSHICEEQFKPYATSLRSMLADKTLMPRLKAEIVSLRKSKLAEVRDLVVSTFTDLALHGTTLERMNGTCSLKKHIDKHFLPMKPVDSIDVFSKEPMMKVLTNKPGTIFTAKSKVPPEDSETVCRMAHEIRRVYADYFVLGDMLNSVDQLTLLSHAWDYLHEFVSQNNLVLLSDTNHILSEIIGKDETPFIYERMGVQFHHFLIDEFQDTSNMQWENLRPLIANSLGSHYDNLIIGDEKQSIYRFRNSDSSLLHTHVAYRDFPKSRYSTKIAGGGDGENTNYRSSGDIVRFNNTLFSHLATAMRIEGYENVVQDIPDDLSALPGYVRFEPFETKKRGRKAAKDTDEAGSAPSAPVPGDTGDDKLELDIMARNILRQHHEGGYDWKDIAILVAYNREGAKAVEHLINHYPEVPVLSEESLFVRSSGAVQLVVGVLQIISDMLTAKAEAAAAGTTPAYSKNGKAAISLAVSRYTYYHGKGMPTDEAFDLAINPDHASADQAIPGEMLRSIHAIMDRNPASPAALIETVIHEMVPEEHRRAQVAYLTAFQDFALDYCTRYNPTLRALLRQWDKAKAKLSISSGSDIDAVRVITIHKSKGLEFDCVHIPYGSWLEAVAPQGKWLEFPSIPGLPAELCPAAIYMNFKDREKLYSIEGNYFYRQYKADEALRYVDAMNLTYVAYTRAARELIVYYEPEKGIGARLKEAFESAPASRDTARKLDLAAGYDAATLTYTLGEPTRKVRKDKDKGKRETVELDDYAVYYNDATTVLTTVEDVLELDSDIDSDPADGSPAPRLSRLQQPTETAERDDSARQRGVILHDMLSKVDHLADIPRAVESVRLAMRLDPETTAEMSAALTEMLDGRDARIRRWFAPECQVLKEQAIYLPKGHPLRRPDNDSGSRRPDRMVLNPDGSVDVIDYKFTSEERTSYHDQVLRYMSMMQEMGHERVRGYLWYPFMQKILEVE